MTKTEALRKARAQMRWGHFAAPAGADHHAEIGCPDCPRGQPMLRVYRQYLGAKRESIPVALRRTLVDHLREDH